METKIIFQRRYADFSSRKKYSSIRHTICHYLILINRTLCETRLSYFSFGVAYFRYVYVKQNNSYTFAVVTGKLPFFKPFFHDNPIFSALFRPIAAVIKDERVIDLINEDGYMKKDFKKLDFINNLQISEQVLISYAQSKGLIMCQQIRGKLFRLTRNLYHSWPINCKAH